MSRRLAAIDLRGSLRPTLWVLLGMLATDVYLFRTLAGPSGYIAPIPLFLPQAVILSTLLLIPPRRWWLPLGLYYTYLVVHGTLRSNPPAYSVIVNIADVIEVLVGALLIRRFIPPPRQFSSLTSVSLYVGFVTLASIVGATWGSTARVFIGTPFWETWPRWFLSDVLASLAVAPMILLWVRAGPGGARVPSRTRLVEVAALGCTLVLLAWVQLRTPGADEAERAIQRYLAVPLLVWAAVRFGPRGLLTVLSLVIVLSIAVASTDRGATSPNLLAVQIFLLTVGVPLFGLAALAQERRRAREVLRRSEERYRAVVSNFPHGVVLLFRLDLRHRFADGQGIPELGLDKAAVPGKTLHQVFPAAMANTLEPRYRAALAGAHESFDLTHAERIYHAEVLPVAYTNRPTGMLMLQEVTDERRAQALAAANADLERANRAQSEFVAVVSHEFRTPLTSIQALSELLRDEAFDAEQVQEFAADINREAERLTRMISELLDLDRMASGQMRLRTEGLDFNALVRAAVGTTPPRGSQHPVYLELDPLLPSLCGDPDKLTQVVLNLLSNARKYSPDGGAVTVGTRAEPGEVHLWVQDRGIGIAEEHVEVIFDRYRRVTSGPAATIKGTGLGLPIVRQIAELHGGHVWAESRPGEGSTFHLTLPLQREGERPGRRVQVAAQG